MSDDELINLSDDECGDEDEIILASIESKLSEIQEKIDTLADEKATLRAERQVILDRVEDRKRKEQFKENSLAIDQNIKQQKFDPDKEVKLKELALKYFNISDFRPLQLDTMLTTLQNEDCILIMATGGGKSLTFQLPALLGNGVTVVVSPLLSLMEDQVSALKKFGISVVMITGTTPQDEQAIIHRELHTPTSNLRLVYVTPEKMSKSKRFQNAMEKCYEKGLLRRIVIDEVHCVSQWGHDFRPDYKVLGTMKRQYPDTPILGLTATATEHVIADVRSTLKLHKCRVLRAGFNRTNLVYEVHAKAKSPDAIAEQIAKLIKGRFSGQSGLIYCFTRADCEAVMTNLHKYRLNVAYYHAALSPEERKAVHHSWLNNEIQCIVATVAFGMGIDKSDVRFIIHHSMSKSIENYYQESGRAGRDGKTSYCVLLYQPSDLFKMTVMTCQETSGTKKSYDMLKYCISDTCRRVALARFFGEHFEAKQCNKMCDKCMDSVTMIPQDVTFYAKEVLNVIQNATKKDITFAMLLSEWKTKRSEKSKKLSILNMEKIIIQMFANGILEEKFKAGMYKPFSYCKHGGFARSVMVNSKTVMMQIPQSEVAQFAVNTFKTETHVTGSPAPAASHSILLKSKSNPSNNKRKAAIVFDSDSD